MAYEKALSLISGGGIKTFEGEFYETNREFIRATPDELKPGSLVLFNENTVSYALIVMFIDYADAEADAPVAYLLGESPNGRFAVKTTYYESLGGFLN